MKLLLFDANSIINRAFYGVRPLTTRDGLHTNAVFGFLNIILKAIEAERPEYVCCAFDVKAPTFRHEMYDEYKAGRRAMPEELAMQMPVVKDLLDCMRIPRAELAGIEADDIIGTLATTCEAAGGQCIIVTGDRDSLQLVDEKQWCSWPKQAEVCCMIR